MANPVSYLIFFLVLWIFFNFIDNKPKAADIVGAVFKYVFSFIWPTALLFGAYVYFEKNVLQMAVILSIIALALVVPCTVFASENPSRTWSKIKNFFYR